MPKRKAKSYMKSSLPKHRPKRTGKAGIGPKEDAPAGELLTAPGEEKPKKPRQARLPEMDDPEIEELEAAAQDYAEIRDERMALTPREKKLKDDLLAAMIRHNREKYVRGNIEIKVVREAATVKVRIKKTSEDEEEASAATA